MARRPGFFALAGITLALGIGANGALFSLLDAIYFRSLPLDPDRLFRLESTSPKAFLGLVSHHEFEEIAAGAPAFDDVVEMGSRGVLLHFAGESEMLRIDYVSPNFFEAMRIDLHLGLGFRRDDVGTPQVIVNHHLWRERLSGREDVLGSTIQLNDTAFTIVGVADRRLVGLDRTVRTDVWVMTAQAPLVVPRLAGELSSPYHRWFETYARLAPDASVEQARQQLEAVALRWEREAPLEYPESGLQLTAVDESRRQSVRDGLAFLTLPALVLLIACANVANLFLARSEGRRRELAIRTAVGAGKGRLLRLLVAESFLLALAGTALGTLFASWGVDLFPALVPPGLITHTIDAHIDERTILFTLMLLALSTILVTLAPALRSGRRDVVADLKGEIPQFRAPARVQHGIVALQVAVGVVVLVGATLLVRSFFYSASLDPGFDTKKGVGTFYVVPALRGHSAEATYRIFEESREKIAALPSVRRVSYGIRLPAQDNEAGWAMDFVVPGQEPPPGQEAFRLRYTMVGPDYFEVVGTRILQGRGIEEIDRPDSERVAVVSETMAKVLFRDMDAIGATLFAGKDRVPTRVVGVAEDVKISSLYEVAEMYVYVPFSQNPQGFGLVLAESDNADTLELAVKRELGRIDPTLPVLEASSIDRHMKLVLFEEHRDAAIAAGVALLALVLTAVGIYAVVTMVTSTRTREIGIRMALGARRNDVVRLVLERGVRLASIGAALGVAGSFAISRLLESRLHGVAPGDPVAFAAAAGLVLTIAVAATLLPALRASRLDPSRTLRSS